MSDELTRRLTGSGGVRETTAAIQAAVDAAGARGGGAVTLPAGTWTVATIALRSGVRLHLQRGCVLRVHTDLADYPRLPRGHNGDRQPYHLLYADGCQGVTIEGDGVIDGNGFAFWNKPPRDLAREGVDVAALGLPDWFPLDGPYWWARGPRVSPLVEIRNCSDVVLRDLTIKESPGWTVHLFCCDRARIDGIAIDNFLYGPNNDGLDINGCRDVIVSNCRICGCDDNIILKATDDARSCERIAVTNCVLKSNCAALGIGAETDRGIRDVVFSNCVVEQALRMVQIEMWNPGTVENVAIANISGRTMTPEGVMAEKVIYLDIQQHRRPEPVLGRLRNVVISNVTAETRGRILMTAQDGAEIEDVTLRDVQLTYPAVEDAPRAMLGMKSNQNSNFNPETRLVNSVMVADNVRRLRVFNLSARLPPHGPDVPAMHGIYGRNVHGAVIDCPMLSANAPGLETFVFKGGGDIVRRA